MEAPGSGSIDREQRQYRQTIGEDVVGTPWLIDRRLRPLAYASAGHPPILLLRANGEIETLEEGGLVLAYSPDAPYSAASVPLNPSDRLLLYTDGLLEAADLRGAFFGDARLFENLRKTVALDLPSSLAHLIGDLNAWRGPNAPLTDDVTLVAVELRPYLNNSSSSLANELISGSVEAAACSRGTKLKHQ